MDFPTFSRHLHKQAGNILESSLSDDECLKALSENHTFVGDLNNCIIAIQDRREKEIFKLAQKEYEFALFALTQGYYRHAFSSLRLNFELCLSAIFFSTNEFLLRRWERDECDIHWEMLMDPDKGLFSKDLVQAFHEGAEERRAHYHLIAKKVYRECSEYVHGNSHTHKVLPRDLEFSKENLLSWCEKASSIKMVILYCFYVRYLADMDDSKKVIIQDLFIETLGHIPFVRSIFGAST